jgi:hypothetical protein
MCEGPTGFPDEFINTVVRGAELGGGALDLPADETCIIARPPAGAGAPPEDGDVAGGGSGLVVWEDIFESETAFVSKLNALMNSDQFNLPSRSTSI